MNFKEAKNKPAPQKREWNKNKKTNNEGLIKRPEGEKS